MTKLAAALPKGQANGLSAIDRDLVEHPDKVHVIVALVRCDKITLDVATDEQEATLRIGRVEVIPQTSVDEVLYRMRMAWEERTGQGSLPLALEAGGWTADTPNLDRDGTVSPDDDPDEGEPDA